MNFGLSDEQYQFILQQVVKPLEAECAKVWCFGSRARGDHKKFSDLDLLIESEHDISAVLGDIEEQLIESNFPFKVDLVQSEYLAETYRYSVEQDKVLFFKEQNNKADKL